MRKKLLVAVFVIAAAMALTVVLSAADPAFTALEPKIDDSVIPQCHLFGDEAHGSSIHCDGWYNENCAKVLLRYTVNGTQKTATYPAYYILENESTLTWNFERLGAYLGTTLSVESIVQIQIPYGVTDIPERAFVDNSRWDPTVTDDNPRGHALESSTLTYVYIPNTVLNIGDFAFAHCVGLDTFAANDAGATGDHNHQMVQTIGYRAFHGCPLTSFVFNNHLVHLGEGCFEGCNMESIDLSRCIELTEIPKRAFHEAEATGVNIILSNSIATIGDQAFMGLHADTIYLGTSVHTIGSQAFECDRINSLFIPVTVTNIAEDSFSLGSQNVKSYIVGPYTEEEAEALVAVMSVCSGKLGKLDSGKLITRTDEYFTLNSNACDMFGGHAVDHNSAVTSVSYPNGIQHAGVAKGSCGICLSEVVETALTPIIVAKGYSVCTYNGVHAFSNGYEVYHDALAVYEQVYGVCEIGILFLLDSKYIVGSDLRADIGSMGIYLDENSMLADGQTTYTAMDYKMTYSKGISYEVTNPDGSITTVDRGSAEIVIAAYMLHSDSTMAGELSGKSYYVQDTDDLCVAGKTADDKYYTVSYNSIYGMIQSQGLQ
ncbi:MAG: leucine-rich repeat domain-containing protein [Ruminococcaceae bacterium]|nr:leucine-rich repeat domain-containing protein [Oscillospiraceae bacterium]